MLCSYNNYSISPKKIKRICIFPLNSPPRCIKDVRRAKIALSKETHPTSEGQHTEEKGTYMNNSTQIKKQTRILIVSIALITAFASVMILITAMQSRNRGEDKPPLTIDPDTSADTSSKDRPHVRPEDTNPSDSATAPDDKKKTDLPNDSDAAQVNTPDDALPDFISPLSGSVSRVYSMEVPVYSLTMNDYRTHGGVDIAAELGASVRAAASGVVTDVWEDPMMGKCVRIEHAGGAVSVYKNLAPETPAAICTGASVEIGAVIGTVGETALIELADAPHLHYELMIDGISVDPADFMLLGTADTAYEG